MEIRPIFSSLMRGKVALVLIGLQIALTLAIVCNAMFIVVQRVERMQRPSGLDEADTFEVASVGFGARFDARAAVREDLATLRALPGVVDAAPINRVPMGRSGWSTAIALTPGQKTPTVQTAIYMVDDHAIHALGATLVAGRDFTPEEVEFRELHDPHWPPGVIVTRALAERLFPDGSPVGKVFYLDQTGPGNRIVGVVDRLQAPWIDAAGAEYSTLVPQIRPYGLETRYMIRAEPGRRDALMPVVEAKLAGINPDRIVRNLLSMQEVRASGYRADRMMAVVLAIVCGLLLAVTALSLVGMASFWVVQRTRQIGTRRALGATRNDIRGYFQTENFIITTIGLAGGGVLAYALSLWLMRNYGMPRLPLYYVPAGSLGLWILGQLAVLGPATRAARVPPAVATRSV
jgi:putative ABC transport system permease protein